jgi:hypothetical protein
MNVRVNVLAARHDEDGVSFHCTWEDSAGMSHSGPIDFPFGSGRNRVSFELDDRTGLNLEFHEQPHDAIWFQTNACPVAANGADLGQITDKQVHKGLLTRKRKKLTLTNRNTQACNLHYALRFTGRPWTNSQGQTHQPPYACDPEFRNNGGGG